MDPVITRMFRSTHFARKAAGVDTNALLVFACEALEQCPRSRSELAPVLAGRFPGFDAESLAYAVSFLLPLLQVPPRGIWGAAGQARLAPTDSWLTVPDLAPLTLEQLVLRYLAAFGPASVKDIQAWCGLTRLSEVTERLGAQLRVYHNQNGVALYDLRDAALPDPDTPAPPRFLAEYDNALLGYADRTRVVAPPHDNWAFLDGALYGTLLIDGFVGAKWKFVRERGTVLLVVEPFAKLNKGTRAAVCEEGARLLAFAASDAHDYDIRIV
jgi:hypothetical protein